MDMKHLKHLSQLLLISIAITSFYPQAKATEKAEVIQLSIMSPKVGTGWAWVRMGLKIGDHITPVEYEWRRGRITMSTVCRNANANLSFEDCLKAAKAIFGNRCKTLNEAPYCEAFEAL